MHSDSATAQPVADDYLRLSLFTCSLQGDEDVILLLLLAVPQVGPEAALVQI